MPFSQLITLTRRSPVSGSCRATLLTPRMPSASRRWSGQALRRGHRERTHRSRRDLLYRARRGYCTKVSVARNHVGDGIERGIEHAVPRGLHIAAGVPDHFRERDVVGIAERCRERDRDGSGAGRETRDQVGAAFQ